VLHPFQRMSADKILNGPFDIEVHVVGLEARSMERVLGPEMGDFVRRIHEGHGVIFHLGDTVVTVGNSIRLASEVELGDALG
jgi:NADPH-dependent 2,4-dienoyl-CoA reductase/sulfur reductase-like enzyme